jgi:hypothetical protein
MSDVVGMKKLARRDWLKDCTVLALAASGLGARAQHDSTVLVVGDSLSAEYGLRRGTGWVALLEKRLTDEKIPAHVVNASISGDTTSGGRSRLAALLTQHRRFDDEGARQRDPLLLAARQHLRVVAQPLAEADPAEHLGREAARVGAALQLEREHHVLEGIQIAEQLETLEHEPHLRGPHRGARILVEREQVGAGEPHRPRRRRVEAGDQRQQRALARTRGADDRGRLACREAEIDLMENRQRAGGIADLLGQTLDNDDGFGHG